VSNFSNWWRRKGLVSTPLPTVAGAAALAILCVGDGARAQQCTTSGTNQTCTNSIFLSGGAIGISDGATLTVTNTISGTISGSIFGINATDTANVTNFGTITGGVFGINATNTTNIINFGSISGNIGISSTTSNVTQNLGIISGIIFGISAGTATVNNSGSISGGTSGIFATTVTVANFGTIFAGAGGSGINATGTAGVTNSGSVSGGAFGIVANIADVFNSGTLSGSTAGLSAASGNVTNSGSISGASGISFGGTADVFNAGTITGTGGTAISFGAGLNTLTLGPGFAINGKVIGAATDTFQLGGTGIGTFDLGLIGAAQQYEGFTTFNKVGGSIWTVTGTFSQPNPWTVQNGTLLVNGDLSAASGITVNSSATLGGIGTVSNATVNNGGTLAPGPPNSVGTLHLTGNLVLASAASYLVQVSPVAASLTSASGTASIGGTLVANGIGGTYTVGQKYAVLTALGGVTGTFSSLAVKGTFGSTKPTITYDANDAFLVLAPAGLAAQLPSGSSTNVTNVANAIDAANSGTLPLAFHNLFNLSPPQVQSALTQLSGEAGTGVAQGAFRITNEFLSLLMDPFENNHDAAPAKVVAPPMLKALKAPKALVATAPRLNVWGALYGSTNSTNGDPGGLGSHDLTTHTSGFATGLDYRIAPDTTVGFALAGGGTSWSLSQGLGGGRSDVFQAGIYGSRQFGATYLSGALAYGSHWASTSRIVAVGGTEQLNTSFDAQSLGGRLEGGYHVMSWMPFRLTPYAALQAQSFTMPAHSESSASGVPQFALAYSAQTATGVRGEIGSWADKTFALASGTGVHLIGRIGWAHDWQNNPQLGATFLGLPAASFVVNGATPPTDLFLLTSGTEWRWRTGWSLLVKFDGELSSGSRTYAGTGRLRYAW